MITGAEIGLGIQALKTALNLAKEAKDLTDTTAIRGKIIEMQSLIMEAQVSAIDAREAHSAQVETIRELKETIRGFENWDAEKARYELKPIGSGSVAYMLKPEMRGSQPPHWLCANCYEKGQKAFLQRVPSSGAFGIIFECAACSAKMKTGYDSPEWVD